MARRSQLQREVLRLYRAFLVVSRGKPEATRELVRETFRENATIKRTDTLLIEYLLRRGRRQLETLKRSDGVTRLSDS